MPRDKNHLEADIFASLAQTNPSWVPFTVGGSLVGGFGASVAIGVVYGAANQISLSSGLPFGGAALLSVLVGLATATVLFLTVVVLGVPVAFAVDRWIFAWSIWRLSIFTVIVAWIIGGVFTALLQVVASPDGWQFGIIALIMSAPLALGMRVIGPILWDKSRTVKLLAIAAPVMIYVAGCIYVAIDIAIEISPRKN